MTAYAARNPRTGVADFQFDLATQSDVAKLADQARDAHNAWVNRSLQERCAVLNKLADEVSARREAIIAALSKDTGRLYLSEREVDGAASNMRRWAKLARDVLPETMKTPDTQSKLVESVRYENQYVPYHVAGFISPWNFPVTLSLIDAVPALAAGCAVIIKPSEVTSRFVAPLLEAVYAVPELKHVLQFVLGDGATGAALINSVDLICFTGSVKTGRLVAEAAARKFIPAFLELGGKDPVIVTKTADIERAADAVLRGSIMNSGQVCLSIERVYVDEAIEAKFLKTLTQKAQAIALNTPDITRGHIGPLIFDRQASIIESHIQDAKSKGAQIHCGGVIERHEGGHWLRPTVLSNVSHDMAIMTQESFGPLLPVMRYSSVEQAIELANDTSYGLSAAVIAGTLDEAKAIAQHIDAGGLSLMDCGLTYMTYEPEKTSFGLSGLGGSRMGPASIQRFLRKKALISNLGVPQSMDAFGEAAASVRLAETAA